MMKITPNKKRMRGVIELLKRKNEPHLNKNISNTKEIFMIVEC